MLKLLKYLSKKDWCFIGISIVFIVGMVFLDLKLPSYMSDITTLLQTGGTIKEILIKGSLMLACALGSAVGSGIVGFFIARVAAEFSARLREKIFNKVQSYSLNEIKKFSTASLITRSTNDVTQIKNLVAMGLQVLIKAPILAIWAIVIILGKSWQWSLLTAAVVGLIFVLIIVIVVCVIPKFKKIQTLTDGLNRTMRENLTGVRVVRAYNAEKYEEEKFGEVNTEFTKVNLFTNRVMTVLSPFMTLMMSGLSLGIYWIGAGIIQSTEMSLKLATFSDMVVFMSYAIQIVMSFIMLVMVMIMLPRTVVSARRIREVLDTDSIIIDGNDDFGTIALRGQIEFKNVAFKYPDADEYVLKDINFTANKGETVAFIGSTGSGKSTLINLVPRFYDATEGEILIDGVDVKKYKQQTLNNKIGYVAQKAFIFNGTVNSNIAYGETAEGIPTEEDIKKAVKIAQATSFVEKMENGYNAEITQSGTNISGGQKQRLSIARAIARKPEIMIFDDSFSALDYQTDKRLRQALKKEIKNTTNLIVAQRIGTIKDADKIIVLEKGQVVGIGKHQDLMKSCAVYKEIATSQLSKEELV